MSHSLLVIAGEISGDMHAARVIRELRERDPDLVCWGIGGDELAAAGVKLRYDLRDMAVLGLWEVLKRYLFFRRVFRDMLNEVERRKPEAVLLVDYPGFNLRFARAARKRGVKILYYISPQVWAWNRSRVRRMAEWIDRLMVIFPFEVEVFNETSLRVDFVGHPLVDRAREALKEPAPKLPWAAEGTRVALLPGSRQQEVERIFPLMLAAACRIEGERPDTAFLVAAPSDRIAALSQVLIDQTAARPANITVVAGHTRHVLRQARGAMVASGTATIEAALMACPMIILYKTAALTYWFGKRLIRVPWLGMVNIVAQRLLCPEFLQHDTDPDRMAQALLPLLDDTPERSAMVSGLTEVKEALGEGDSAGQAADIIHQELHGE